MCFLCSYKNAYFSLKDVHDGNGSNASVVKKSAMCGALSLCVLNLE